MNETEDTRWVKLSAALTDWRWFGKPETLQLYVYLLLKAAPRDTERDGETLRRGQLRISVRTLARELRLTERKVRTSLARLKKSGDLAIETTAGGVQLLTLPKYPAERDTPATGENRHATDTLQAGKRHVEAGNLERRKVVDTQVKSNVETGNRVEAAAEDRHSQETLTPEKRHTYIRILDNDIVVSRASARTKGPAADPEEADAATLGAAVAALTERRTYWTDVMCMRHRLSGLERLRELLADFTESCVARGKTRHDSLADLKAHADSWLSARSERERRAAARDNDRQKNTANGTTYIKEPRTVWPSGRSLDKGAANDAALSALRESLAHASACGYGLTPDDRWPA